MSTLAQPLSTCGHTKNFEKSPLPVRHHYVTEKRHQNNVTKKIRIRNTPIKIFGYGSVSVWTFV